MKLMFWKKRNNKLQEDWIKTKNQLQNIINQQQAEIQTLKQDFEILQKKIFKKTYNDRKKIIKAVNTILKKHYNLHNKAKDNNN